LAGYDFYPDWIKEKLNAISISSGISMISTSRRVDRLTEAGANSVDKNPPAGRSAGGSE
jgi:predicted alpha/beta superfamily hydrolase